MFDSGAGESIAQRQEEVVVIKMSRAIKLVGLTHQLAMNFENLWSDLQKLRLVSHHVQRYSRAAVRIEIESLEIFARENRRIDQRFIRHGFECRCRTAHRKWLQRGGELPTLGQ